MKIFDYCKLRKRFNTLENEYETLKKESQYKDRTITRLKNKINQLKEEEKIGRKKDL